MTKRQKQLTTKERLVWERPQAARRPAPGPLNRDRILRAAIKIADKQGLPSVSLRKVAAALDVGPMRLYGHVSTKEELLDLMVDAMYGEMASSGPVNGDWRAALRSIAQRTRQAAQKHPWFIDLLGGRPHFGPNALAHREESFGALLDTPGFEHIDVVMQALRTVNAYVIGAIWSEASQLRNERESGLDEAEWQAALWPYIERTIATGKFPMLEKIVRDATHRPADVEFNEGLECVLDGIAARFGR
jgi:AcrR family transcriptional regulator